MKFFRSTVPNLTISLSVVLIVIDVLDFYNPVMGFLHSSAARVLILLTAIFSLAASLASYLEWRRETRPNVNTAKRIGTNTESD